MINHKDYALFIADKQRFFKENHTIGEAQTHAKEQYYSFIMNNHNLITQEFNQLFAALKKEPEHQKEYWLYCYYLADLLKRYFAARGKKAEEHTYASYGRRFKSAYEHGILPDADEEPTIVQAIVADLTSLATTPFHVAKIKKLLGFTNMYRIHFLFCRLTVKQFVVLAKALQWIEGLNQSLGIFLDPDEMTAIINAPAPIFNFLSVGLFAARLTMNLAMTIKHVAFPNALEANTTWQERLYHEWCLRRYHIVNDIVWGFVNLLTNYNFIVELSAPVASWITVGFLLFDMTWLIINQYWAEKEFQLKNAQYKRELSELQNAMALDDGSKNNVLTQRKKLLEQQMEACVLQREKTVASFQCNVVAAALLAGGFSATLLLATPATVFLAYLVCTVGVALYLSADLYGAYKEKLLVLKDQDERGLPTKDALKDMQAARNNFIWAMVRNSLMPLLIVGTFVVCWPAAIALTVLYVAYVCGKGYFKAGPQKPKPTPDLIDPEVLSDDSLSPV